MTVLPVYYKYSAFSLASFISLAARRRLLRLFLRECGANAAHLVLDVGVTADATRPESNFFEQWYPHPERVVGLGIEDLRPIAGRFRGLHLVQARGDQLPFGDGVFDAVFSNAVVEHVGPRLAQRRFVHELVRAGKQCFIGTPDRSFPIETHTALPLLHYLPNSAFRWALRVLGREDLADADSLNLLWPAAMKDLCPHGGQCRLLRVRVLGIGTNLVLHVRSREASAADGGATDG